MKVISKEEPNENELRASNILREFMEKQNLYLKEEGKIFRDLSIDFLSVLLKKWVNSYVPDELKSIRGGCKILLSGSYALGDLNSDSDLDLVLVCPSFITWDNFFYDLKDLLLQESQISDLQAIPTAFVPILKFSINGVKVDLLFSRVNIDLVKDDFSVNEIDMELIDEESSRALTGPICAQELLKMIPNKEIFLCSLKFIKFWAKRRNIYGNSFGFPGGISWAILVAKICCNYPKACLSVIIHRLFWMFSGWKWPNPVILKKIEKKSKLDNNVWDPRSSEDVMPIITPTYPNQNSTHNVGLCQLDVFTEELWRGKEILESLVIAPKEDQLELIKRLVEESDFFIKFKLFLCVQVEAKNKVDFGYYASFIESKVRVLCDYLKEINENLHIRLFPQMYIEPNSFRGKYFLGLFLRNRKKGKKKEVDVGRAIDKFRSLIIKLKIRSEYTKNMNIPRITVVQRKDLPQYVVNNIKKRQLHQRKRSRENVLMEMEPENKKSKI